MLQINGNLGEGEDAVGACRLADGDPLAVGRAIAQEDVRIVVRGGTGRVGGVPIGRAPAARAGRRVAGGRSDAHLNRSHPWLYGRVVAPVVNRHGPDARAGRNLHRDPIGVWAAAIVGPAVGCEVIVKASHFLILPVVELGRDGDAVVVAVEVDGGVGGEVGLGVRQWRRKGEEEGEKALQ